jgi:Leucine-rich repeat (LRR) protein
VERNTQVLNISGNDIPIFGRAHFSRLGLINLQRVSCARCNLVSVDAKAFLGLTNLVELDLSNNKLVEVSKSFTFNVEGSSKLSFGYSNHFTHGSRKSQ